GYYRDVRNWVSTSPLILTAQPGVAYSVYTNRDYANTRGVTLSFNRRFLSNWGFDASYTFQVVEGSNSNPADFFFALQGNSQPKLALLPLNWDQRHKVAGAFYVGGSDWGASTRFRAESGFPYTPSFPEAAIVGNDVQPEFAENSRRIPGTWEIDLSAHKDFDLGPIQPRVFVEVFNLFDRRNVQSVFSDTGEPDVTLTQFQTGSFDPGYFVRPDFYREPRRIQLGLQFNF
ncbi:MAG: TonB-dependent receptor, partial [Rhodothermia bacterium]|nr:TonB-dependent receptor [Rhodothermia bacterium]